MTLQGSFKQFADRWNLSSNWENNFKSKEITVYPSSDSEYSREIDLYMLFDPIVTEEFGPYTNDYYKKWTDAYKKATSSFPY